MGIANGVLQGITDNINSRKPEVLFDEKVLSATSAATIGRYSNLGSENPFKGPSPRTLFYDGGFRDPNKYGQFLMYHLGNSEGNDFMDAYYRSESRDFNQRISPLASKNPSAAVLIRLSNTIEAAALNPGLVSAPDAGIIGGISAPYNWKDFLFCKYYGTIPNNYMITLRRFSTPVKDNLSLPETIKSNAEKLKEGVGRPVAQAVTWWGGDTGNSLNDIISFTTGLAWDSKTQAESGIQGDIDTGLLNSKIASYTRSLLQSTTGVSDQSIGNVEEVLNLAAMVSDPASVTERQRLAYSMRDKAQEPGGPLSDFIWTSVDTIDKTYVRGRGLSFAGKEMNIKFHYDLTSVGEVNTKAAMLDLMASLLGLATNYGQFLTPDFRYNNGFPAIGFPGGSDGLNEIYLDPLSYMDNFQAYLSESKKTLQDSAITTIGNSEDGITTIGDNLTAGDATQQGLTDENSLNSIRKLLKIAGTKSLIESMQLPLSFLTGAPIGEWHLVVGNPLNPIAMIGNLICKNVDISFSDKLGPDDFPAEMIATFALEHGRDRERGEIESMFNRGDGRLYESSLPTYANGQSEGAFATTDGGIVSQQTVTDLTNGVAYVQSQADSVVNSTGN